jgi:hypothetical protein
MFGPLRNNISSLPEKFSYVMKEYFLTYPIEGKKTLMPTLHTASGTSSK